MLKIDLADKTVIVTGGAGTVGKAICRAFSMCGANVAICDRNPAAAAATADEINAAGGRAYGFELKLGEPHTFNAVADAIIKKFGSIDIIINNENRELSPDERKELHEFDMALYDELVFEGIDGVFAFSQAAMQDMVSRKNGVIVNVTSIRGLVPVADQTPVIAASAAVIGMTKMWAAECKDVGVRVNAIAAGLSINEQNSSYLKDEKTVAAKFTHNAINRPCEPDDIANAALFLASAEASYVTGIIMPVDGGLSAGYVRSF